MAWQVFSSALDHGPLLTTHSDLRKVPNLQEAKLQNKAAELYYELARGPHDISATPYDLLEKKPNTTNSRF